VFDTNYATPQLSQATSATNAVNGVPLTLLSQPANQVAGGTADGGDLVLLAGAKNSSGDLDGNIIFGLKGLTLVSYFIAGQIESENSSPIGVSMWDFNTTVVRASSGTPESHVISRNSGIQITEDIQWFTTTTSSTAQFLIPITSIEGTAGIPSNSVISVIYKIFAKGGTTTTIVHELTAYKSAGGILNWNEHANIVNVDATVISANIPNANEIDLGVTPQSSTSTVWVVKMNIVVF
jgi:hypothetical protein